MPTESELKAKLKLLGDELDKRAEKFRTLESYRSGERPVPEAVKNAKATASYRRFMSLAPTNYAQLIIRAASSRMEIGGVKCGNEELEARAWDLWQNNRMDAEFRRATDSLLTHGRVFAIVRPGPDGPEIILENAATVVVEYAEGSRYRRTCALRRWADDDGFDYSTLYYPDATFQFRSSRKRDEFTADRGREWDLVDGAPLDNPFGVVPAIEISTNGGLAQGRFGAAFGDYEGAVGQLERIDTLEFLRLIIAFTASFPVRVVIGDKILRDDEGKQIAPFELGVDVVAQLENPGAKLQEFAAADLKSFGEAIDHDIEALAGVTQTPAYYLRSVPIQNVNADAIRASDMPLNARVEDHKPFIAEGVEEVLRVALLMDGKILPQSASMKWVSRESRSISEKADAATKLKDILPWQAIAADVLDYTQEEVRQIEQMRASDVFTSLLSEPDAVPVD